MHNVNPSNYSSIASQVSSGCHLLNMAPGVYSSGIGTVGDVTIRCEQKHQCFAEGWDIVHYGTVIIEDMKFGRTSASGGGNNNYGLSLYYGDAVLLRGNAWDTTKSTAQTHSLSIKNTVARAEILDNTFTCFKHCIEISQNGNIRTRKALAGDVLIQGNTFSSANNDSNGISIINRNSCDVRVDNNVFSSGREHLFNSPEDDLYPYGSPGDRGEIYVPKCPFSEDHVNGDIIPLKTSFTNNTANGGVIVFVGRGVLGETIYLKNNSGITGCTLEGMRGASVHQDEQTTAAPALASGSDSC